MRWRLGPITQVYRWWKNCWMFFPRSFEGWHQTERENSKSILFLGHSLFPSRLTEWYQQSKPNWESSLMNCWRKVSSGAVPRLGVLQSCLLRKRMTHSDFAWTVASWTRWLLRTSIYCLVLMTFLIRREVPSTFLRLIYFGYHELKIRE